uniref:Uncharacterized protein n=1 Tax=Oryza rufipogon TaxID=4529 RepID=A0A0E0QNG5_ORYRU
MEIPTINLDNTFDFETMYTADDAGSLRAHNVANDEMQVFATNDQMQVFEANDEMQVFATNDQMQVFEANDEMQVFATNDQMQVFEANDEMQLFEEMSDHADTMHTSVATGATTATANTISSEDSGTDDSEAQSAPSQDFLCSTQVPYLTLTFNSEEEARAHYNRYAKCVGFSIKINTSRKSAKDGEQLYGGARNVPYTRKDISNFKSKLGSEYRCRDMPQTIAHFEEIKKDDPNFFYKIQLNKEDRVQNIFWVDGAARNAYKDYKDCISFDCTYMTNMYNMPCAPFIGIKTWAINSAGLWISKE